MTTESLATIKSGSSSGEEVEGQALEIVSGDWEGVRPDFQALALEAHWGRAMLVLATLAVVDFLAKGDILPAGAILGLDDTLTTEDKVMGQEDLVVADMGVGMDSGPKRDTLQMAS